MAALDTNVLLRFLLQDDAVQSAAANRLVRAANATGDALYVSVSVTLELEWVLRSRFKMGKAAVLQTFFSLLETTELRFERASALEWSLNQYDESAADFSDCLHAALASMASEQPFWTFDKAAARLHGAALLA